MEEININKAIITIINILVLIGIPIMARFHIIKAKKEIHLSYEWWIQIMFVIMYISCLTSEIPAFWSRYRAYYELKLTINDTSLYVLTTWDRWNHLLNYLIIYLITYSVSKKEIPNIV